MSDICVCVQERDVSPGNEISLTRKEMMIYYLVFGNPFVIDLSATMEQVNKNVVLINTCSILSKGRRVIALLVSLDVSKSLSEAY